MAETTRPPLQLILLTAQAGGERRVHSDHQREVELATAGWQRRFVADAARAEETIALYQQLGFEVLVEPVHLIDTGDDCDDCRLLMQRDYQTIYTRKRVTHDNTNGNP